MACTFCHSLMSVVSNPQWKNCMSTFNCISMFFNKRIKHINPRTCTNFSTIISYFIEYKTNKRAKFYIGNLRFQRFFQVRNWKGNSIMIATIKNTRKYFIVRCKLLFSEYAINRYQENAPSPNPREIRYLLTRDKIESSTESCKSLIQFVISYIISERAL